MMHRWWIFLGRRADELKPEIPRQAAGGPEDGGAGLYELARQARACRTRTLACELAAAGPYYPGR